MLSINNLTVAYGGAKALDDLSIEVKQGEFVVLLGANGAGKTTTLKAISGLISPASGEIHFEGVNLRKRQGFQRSGDEIGRAHV